MTIEADQCSTSHISSPPRYTDEPPRLSVCLEELLLGEDRAAEGAEVPALVPDGTKLRTGEGAGWVGTAVRWITDVLLYRSVGEAWEMPAGRNDVVDPEDPEEKWARAIEERFLGHAYGGPNITAQIPKLPPPDPEASDPYEDDESEAAEDCRAPDIGERMVLYIYQRFQPKVARWRQATNDKIWWGAGPASIDWQDNDDPCYSIWMACQYLATYVNLARGFTLEEHLNRAGFTAGQCGHVRIFNMKDGGTWFSTAGAPEQSAWATIESSQLSVPAQFQRADDAGKTPLGPGTIYTFNPYGDAKSKVVKVPRSACYWDDDNHTWVVDPQNKAAVRVELASAKAVADHNKQVDDANRYMAATKALEGTLVGAALGALAPTVAAKAGQDKKSVVTDGNVTAVPPDPMKPKDKPVEGEELVEATLVFHAQVPGSHIFAVLRRWQNAKGERVFQVLDTNSHPQTARKPEDKSLEDAARREYAMWNRTSHGGIYCGQYLGVIPLSAGNKFVGMGTMPEVDGSKLETMTEHLMKCRPVGLARLVVTLPERWNPKYPGIPPELSVADVLYVSRAALMWGPKEQENYPISQYLLSLNNMPYYKSLQAFWLIYAPCEELARVMFARGAREKTLDALVDEATELRRRRNEAARDPKAKKPYPPKFYNYTSIKLTTVLTHDANGKPRVAWRGNDLTGTTGTGAPPKPIKTLFMDTSFAYRPEPKELNELERAQRDILAEYVHPSFKVDEISQLEVPPYLTAAGVDPDKGHTDPLTGRWEADTL